jgi:hypothetical protein
MKKKRTQVFELGDKYLMKLNDTRTDKRRKFLTGFGTRRRNDKFLAGKWLGVGPEEGGRWLGGGSGPGGRGLEGGFVENRRRWNSMGGNAEGEGGRTRPCSSDLALP